MKKLLIIIVIFYNVLYAENNTSANQYSFSPSKFYNVSKVGNYITTDLYSSVDFFKAENSRTTINFGLGVYLQFQHIHVYNNIYLNRKVNVINEKI